MLGGPWSCCYDSHPPWLWHIGYVVALVGSNNLEIVRMHMRYHTPLNWDGVFLITIDCCKSKFNPVAAGSSKAYIFEETLLLQ